MKSTEKERGNTGTQVEMVAEKRLSPGWHCERLHSHSRKRLDEQLCSSANLQVSAKRTGVARKRSSAQGDTMRDPNGVARNPISQGDFCAPAIPLPRPLPLSSSLGRKIRTWLSSSRDESCQLATSLSPLAASFMFLVLKCSRKYNFPHAATSGKTLPSDSELPRATCCSPSRATT